MQSYIITRQLAVTVKEQSNEETEQLRGGRVVMPFFQEKQHITDLSALPN
jgi:uncharacterized membrane protein YqiK